MLPFKLIYSPEYYLPIGQHVFPAEKYWRIHDRLFETGVAEPADFSHHTPHRMKTYCLSTSRSMCRS